MRPAPCSHGLRIEEITAPEALEALRPEWTALFEADPAASPFQSPEWLLAWRRAFLGDGRLWSLAARAEGELVGLAPFFLHQDGAGGGRQLTLLGNGISDRLDLIARPEARGAVAEALAARLAANAAPWDSADLRDLPQASPLLGLPLDGAAQSIEPDAPCPVLDLPETPEAVVASLPRSRRKHLQRCAHALAEIAPLRLTRADAASLDEHLAALVQLHRARWRERGDVGVLAEADLVSFHEEAAAGLLARGLLRLEALRVGKRVIAALYALRRGDSCYGYLQGFDPEFAAFAPGWLLLARSLEAAVRDGVRRFDFLRGREAYKYAWGATDRPQWRRRVWR